MPRSKQTWPLPPSLAWYSLCCSPAGLFSARIRMFAGGTKQERERLKKKKKEGEGRHKGFSRQTNGRLNCSNTAAGHTLCPPHARTHIHTQAPLDQMTASELGGIALAFFLPAHTHTHDPSRATCSPRPDSNWPRLPRPQYSPAHTLGAITNCLNLILALALWRTERERDSSSSSFSQTNIENVHHSQRVEGWADSLVTDSPPPPPLPLFKQATAADYRPAR